MAEENPTGERKSVAILERLWMTIDRNREKGGAEFRFLDSDISVFKKNKSYGRRYSPIHQIIRVDIPEASQPNTPIEIPGPFKVLKDNEAVFSSDANILLCFGLAKPDQALDIVDRFIKEANEKLAQGEMGQIACEGHFLTYGLLNNMVLLSHSKDGASCWTDEGEDELGQNNWTHVRALLQDIDSFSDCNRWFLYPFVRSKDEEGPMGRRMQLRYEEILQSPTATDNPKIAETTERLNNMFVDLEAELSAFPGNMALSTVIMIQRFFERFKEYDLLRNYAFELTLFVQDEVKRFKESQNDLDNFSGVFITDLLSEISRVLNNFMLNASDIFPGPSLADGKDERGKSAPFWNHSIFGIGLPLYGTLMAPIFASEAMGLNRIFRNRALISESFNNKAETIAKERALTESFFKENASLDDAISFSKFDRPAQEYKACLEPPAIFGPDFSYRACQSHITLPLTTVDDAFSVIFPLSVVTHELSHIIAGQTVKIVAPFREDYTGEDKETPVVDRSVSGAEVFRKSQDGQQSEKFWEAWWQRIIEGELVHRSLNDGLDLKLLKERFEREPEETYIDPMELLEGDVREIVAFFLDYHLFYEGQPSLSLEDDPTHPPGLKRFLASLIGCMLSYGSRQKIVQQMSFMLTALYLHHYLTNPTALPFDIWWKTTWKLIQDISQTVLEKALKDYPDMERFYQFLMKDVLEVDSKSPKLEEKVLETSSLYFALAEPVARLVLTRKIPSDREEKASGGHWQSCKILRANLQVEGDELIDAVVPPGFQSGASMPFIAHSLDEILSEPKSETHLSKSSAASIALWQTWASPTPPFVNDDERPFIESLAPDAAEETEPEQTSGSDNDPEAADQ